MATATTMYHTAKNPLHKVTRQSETVHIVKSGKQRRLHKAYLRYHDPKNWAMIRQSLIELGREDLIGHGANCLVPPFNAKLENAQDGYQSARKKNSTAQGDSVKRKNKPQNTATKTTNHPKKGNFQTQHTGLPPRKTR